MMRRTKKGEDLSEQMVRRHKEGDSEADSPPKYDGTSKFISTGSTLLDLAISGGRVHGGGIPGGIMVEVFGPSGSGKTALLCEIAGMIQKQEGETSFHDPEARLNQQFARMFGFDIDFDKVLHPDTVPELFEAIRKWKPKGKKSVV
ncbi:unnamed protein product, partial [marine sediment metagenome]